jgi:hypothetical protein
MPFFAPHSRRWCGRDAIPDQRLETLSQVLPPPSYRQRLVAQHASLHENLLDTLRVGKLVILFDWFECPASYPQGIWAFTVALENSRMNLVEINRPSKLKSLFIYVSASALLLTAIAKLGASFQPLPLLFAKDPILGISYKNIMIYIGTLELVIVLLLLFSKNTFIKLCSITWLGVCFMTYRVFHKLMGVIDPCPCLGTLTSWLHINRDASNLLLNTLSIFMVGFGLYFLLCEGTMNRKMQRTC